MDEELAEEDRKNRKDRMGFDVVLEPPRHDQVIYLTESNLLYTYYIPTRSSGRSAPFLLAPAEGWGAVLGAFGPLFIKMANEWQLNFNKKKILPPTPPTAAPPIYQPWLMAIEWQLNFKKKIYPPPP